MENGRDKEEFEEIPFEIETFDDYEEEIQKVFNLIDGAKLHAEYLATTYTTNAHGYCTQSLLDHAVMHLATINKYIKKVVPHA